MVQAQSCRGEEGGADRSEAPSGWRPAGETSGTRGRERDEQETGTGDRREAGEESEGQATAASGETRGRLRASTQGCQASSGPPPSERLQRQSRHRSVHARLERARAACGEHGGAAGPPEPGGRGGPAGRRQRAPPAYLRTRRPTPEVCSRTRLARRERENNRSAGARACCPARSVLAPCGRHTQQPGPPRSAGPAPLTGSSVQPAPTNSVPRPFTAQARHYAQR